MKTGYRGSTWKERAQNLPLADSAAMKDFFVALGERVDEIEAELNAQSQPSAGAPAPDGANIE